MVKKPRIHIYVEGKKLGSQLRHGMSKFLKKLNLKNMPVIVACGGAGDTLKRFSKALKDREIDVAILLLDSEEAVRHQSPWEHLQNRKDNKCPKKPDGADPDDKDCHLMVQCMESWFLADCDAVANYFKQGFKKKIIQKQNKNIETIEKQQVFLCLEKATEDCKTKRPYNDKTKGEHSFEILEKIDPEKIKAASKWAERFFNTLIEKCNGQEAIA